MAAHSIPYPLARSSGIRIDSLSAPPMGDLRLLRSFSARGLVATATGNADNKTMVPGVLGRLEEAASGHYGIQQGRNEEQAGKQPIASQ
jgi:hypothetical protein